MNIGPVALTLCVLPDEEPFPVEHEQFFAVTDEHQLAALWRLALLTGMRRGELLVLMWDDINLERGMLAVRRTMSRGSAGN